MLLIGFVYNQQAKLQIGICLDVVYQFRYPLRDGEAVE
jgi:hypothetical protein